MANGGVADLRALIVPGVVYGGALLIGLTLVSFPASSSYLKALHGFTDQQYGAIFLPQLLFAIVGALGSAAVVRRLSLKSMFLASLVAFALSQAALGLSQHLEGTKALGAIMAGTALFGFGFGFGGGPLNGIVALLYPARMGSAVTLLHMMAGLGLTLGPLAYAVVIGAGHWGLMPAALALAASALFVLTLLIELPGAPLTGTDAAIPERPARSGYFWLMLATAIFYAFSEGTFSNWCVIYLQEDKGLEAGNAAAALAAFWAGLTTGRLLVSLVLRRAESFLIWVSLTPLMAIAFVLVPNIGSPATAIAVFAFAGLACSAFFPLMVTVASEPFPVSVSFIASMLTAALMTGVGMGSYVIGLLKESMAMDRIYSFSALYPLAAMALMLLSRRWRGGEGRNTLDRPRQS